MGKKKDERRKQKFLDLEVERAWMLESEAIRLAEKRRADAATMPYWELLDQDEFWRTSDGTVIQVAAMTQGHRLNTAALLERRATNLGAARANRIWETLGTFPVDPSDGVFAAMGYLESEAMAWTASPVEMLRSSRLYQRLLEDAVRTMQESQIPYRGLA